MQIYKFELPGFVVLPRKTKADRRISLNLNVYRNLHHSVESQAKKAFWPVLGYDTFKADFITVSYIVEKKSKRKFDTMNVVSIVDKYFLDWLVMEGFIEDDNCTIVSHGSAVGHVGCIRDKITAVIQVIEEHPEQMRIFK